MVTGQACPSSVSSNTNPLLVSARGSCPASPRADVLTGVGAGSLVRAAFYADSTICAIHPSPNDTLRQNHQGVR
ncbi:MAG: hypothetical protein H8K07_01475 [Nitrospira sp.]|nr:hypothetical protein [Nitrospira sp.]